MGACASSRTSRVAASYRDDGSDSSEEERTKWGTHRFYTEHEKVTIGVDQFQVLQHMGHGPLGRLTWARVASASPTLAKAPLR